MSKPIVLVSILAGILLLAVAVIYFINPANSLPSFFPGFDSTITKYHYKHGIGALILGLGAFSFAWFQSGKKLPQEK